MRGSAVFLGLKSWADKLHQQLPLSKKESQRLLTALTSSFRQHLDEVHPRAVAEKRRAATSNSKPAADIRPFHSSVASADNHLASILTNPLLNKPNTSTVSPAYQNYANARLELQKDTGKDPISLLEEYHEKGAASIAIARLCLNDFEEDLKSLPIAKQKATVAQVQPGKRTLLWLWSEKFHESEEFADDHVIIDTLTYALMREGLERYLWEWLAMDQVAADNWRDLPTNRLDKGQVLAKGFHRYRWKGRILRAMVANACGGFYGIPGSVNAALRLYFKAQEMKNTPHREPHMSFLPLHGAGGFLHGRVTHTRPKYQAIDVALYEKFKTCTSSYVKGGPTSHALNESILDLYHPTLPNGVPISDTFRRLFAKDLGPPEAALIKRAGISSSSMKDNILWLIHLTRAIFVLRLQGHHGDAEWLYHSLRERYPGQSGKIEDLMGELVKGDRTIIVPDVDHQPEQRRRSQPVPVPFPTFT